MFRKGVVLVLGLLVAAVLVTGSGAKTSIESPLLKGIFVSNPAEVFTKYTGGREYGFVTEKALFDAVQKIGDELHSHYLISYNPNNKLEGGWHTIRVEVRNRAALDIRTRSGYWLAGVPN